MQSCDIPMIPYYSYGIELHVGFMLSLECLTDRHYPFVRLVIYDDVYSEEQSKHH